MRNYAPEAMAHKNGYVPESDLYSFGILVWEMVHCRYVWNQFPTDKVVEHVLTTKEKPAWELPLYPEVIELINRVLEFEPAARPSPEEVSESLL